MGKDLRALVLLNLRYAELGVVDLNRDPDYRLIHWVTAYWRMAEAHDAALGR